MNRAYFDADAPAFAAADPMAIFGHLAKALQFPVEAPQRSAWLFQIAHLQALAAALPGAHIFLEFAIPRMGRRADTIIVIEGLVFVIEYKVGDRDFSRHAIEQVHGYALDLKNFHVTSHTLAIVPLLIATEALPQQLGLGFWAPDRVHDPVRLSAGDLLPTFGASLRPATLRLWKQRPGPTALIARPRRSSKLPRRCTAAMTSPKSRAPKPAPKT